MPSRSCSSPWSPRRLATGESRDLETIHRSAAASVLREVIGKHVRPMKIVVFCPNLIGDTVMATPTIRAIRGRFPDARLTGVIRPQVAPMLDGTHLVRRADPVPSPLGPPRPEDGRGRDRLRQGRHDVAVFLPNSFRVAWMAWLAGIPRRIGYVPVRPGPAPDRRPEARRATPKGSFVPDADRRVLPGAGAGCWAAACESRPARARDHGRGRGRGRSGLGRPRACRRTSRSSA